MRTLLENLQDLLQSDTVLSSMVDQRNITIGSETIDELVGVRRFPFIVVDRDINSGEAFFPTDAGKGVLRARTFHVSVRIGVRSRSKTTSLMGTTGLLAIYDEVMRVIFSDPTVKGRVERLDENISVNEAEIYIGNTFFGLGREILLTYHTTEEF